MQKISVFIFLSVMVFASCKKDNGGSCGTVNITAPASEVETLRAYITANSISATEDARGFFYKINTMGSGDKPTVCNAVTVNYKGTLTNGTQIDAANNVTLDLSRLIIGWQEGIPLIGTGGSITLYLPPSLAYGSVDYENIPGNSILIFNIDLIAVN
jgi:FKBP-type peptidyl-prolyl cis-trans isomerase FkpA